MKIQTLTAFGCCLFLFANSQALAQKEKKRFTVDDLIADEKEAVRSLDVLVSSDIWSKTGADIETLFNKKSYNESFEWLDETGKTRGVIRPQTAYIKSEKQKDDAEVSITSIKQELNLFGALVYEANLDFKEGKVSSVNISIWNKGDAKRSVDREGFAKIIEQTTANLNKSFAITGKDMGSSSSGSAVRLSRVRWETAKTSAQLESSAGRDEDGFEAEFIRLRAMPKSQANFDDKAANKANVAVSSLVSRVKKTPEGDVYIDGFPMVDQGQKGYCVVASAERVMRYYGIEVDQHELAKAADTSASGGTNTAEFETAIRRLQGRFKIRVKDIISFDPKEHVRLVKDYNREIKKTDGEEWEPYDYRFKFDPKVMLELRSKGSGFEKFRDVIIKGSERGVPLLWSLSLGHYPETGAENQQSIGGHMRTIIGYNTKTDELIFTDSWGAGHEIKRMKGREAYAATKGLYLVEPSN